MSLKTRLAALEERAERQSKGGDRLAIVNARGKTPEEVEHELAGLRGRLSSDAVIIILDEQKT